MQTLVFNTDEKYVILYEDIKQLIKVVEIRNTPTVKIMSGFYEVIQKTEVGSVPVLRLPISNTNMIIKKS